MLYSNEQEEVVYLQYIGKINRNMFKRISNKILTEEVIMTEKQRQHIEERHPGILEKYEKLFPEILQNPDYILNDKTRENTALILKAIQKEEEKESINIVLRLAVEGENENNKNSIITCIPIGKNRVKSYKNNGKIVYKRE